MTFLYEWFSVGKECSLCDGTGKVAITSLEGAFLTQCISCGGRGTFYILERRSKVSEECTCGPRPQIMHKLSCPAAPKA